MRQIGGVDMAEFVEFPRSRICTPEINAEAAVKLVVWEGHPAVPSGNRAFAVLHAKTPALGRD
jgi:hypothetical protein